MYKVYQWINTVNGKRYFGVTKRGSLQARAGRQGINYRGSPHFYAAIQKYGLSKFSSRIVEDNLTKQAAAQLQQQLIRQYNTTDAAYGYNLHIGGFPTSIQDRPQQTKTRISNTLKQQRSSKQYRQLMSARMQKVWDNPDRRAELLQKRKGKLTGRKAVQTICLQTGQIFKHLGQVSQKFKIHKSSITVKFKKSQTIKVKDKLTNIQYTLKKIVHVKDGELLEALPSEVEGNQQPSPEGGDTQGRFNDYPKREQIARAIEAPSQETR